MERLRLAAVVIVCVVGLCGVAWANPGTTSALNGVEDVYTGYLPPPGFHFIDYVLFYDANKIMDANGKAIPGTDAVVIADALRFIYSSNVEILGGRAAWHAVVPLVHKDITTPGFKKTVSGVGDMYLSPLLIGWDLPEDFHIIGAVDTILPIGEYDSNEPVNVGSNHYTIEPVIAVTKIFPDSGLVLDGKFMYDMHTRQSDTMVRTGNQFHVDYAVTMPVTKADSPLRVGVNGYYFTSLEEDKLNGADIANSKEKVFAAGPMARYDFSPQTSLTFKAQFETDAHNRPEGSAFWLKFVQSF